MEPWEESARSKSSHITLFWVPHRRPLHSGAPSSQDRIKHWKLFQKLFAFGKFLKRHFWIWDLYRKHIYVLYCHLKNILSLLIQATQDPIPQADITWSDVFQLTQEALHWNWDPTQPFSTEISLEDQKCNEDLRWDSVFSSPDHINQAHDRTTLQQPHGKEKANQGHVLLKMCLFLALP